MKRIRETISALVTKAKDRAAWTLLRAASRIDKDLPRKAIIFIGQRSPKELHDFIMERANDLSVAVVMTTLDREGIAHCALCPQRFGIKKVGRHYACLNHSEEVKAKAA